MSPREALSSALESVMSRFSRMLRSVGRRRGLDDVDLQEMEQEVRLRLWRALGTSERIETAKTSYIYQTAMSATLDLIRRRRARPEEDLESVEVPTAGSDTSYEHQELGARIDSAVGALDEPRSAVVRLHLSGYHREEIAQLLGWTEPKVRNLLYRGLEDLRALLLERGISPRHIA